MNMYRITSSVRDFVAGITLRILALRAGITLKEASSVKERIDQEVFKPAAKVFLALMEDHDWSTVVTQGDIREASARQGFSFVPYYGTLVTFEHLSGVPKEKITAAVVAQGKQSARVAKHLVVPLLKKKFGQVMYTEL